MPQYIRQNPWLSAAGASDGISDAISKLFLQLPQAQAQARLMGLTGQETQARTGLINAQMADQNQKTQDAQDASARADLAQKAISTLNLAKAGGMSSVLGNGPTVAGTQTLSMGDLLSALGGQAATDPHSSEALLNWHNTPSGDVANSPIFGQVNNPAPVKPTVLRPNETAVNPQTGATIAQAVLRLLSPGQQIMDSTGGIIDQNQTPKQFSPRDMLPTDQQLASIHMANPQSWTNIVNKVLVPFAMNATKQANTGQTPDNTQVQSVAGKRVRFQTPEGRTGSMDATDTLPQGWKIIP